MRSSSSSNLFKPRLLALSVGIAALAGCSTVDSLVHGQDADYESARPVGQQLDVPPDLTQITKQPALTLPAGQAVSAVAYQNASGQPSPAHAGSAPQAQQPVANSAVLPQFPNMRIEEGGGQRWLLIDQQPDQLWDKIKDFWQVNGLYLSKADPQTGDMETDWAENRAQLPMDFIRRHLGQLLGSVYDTSQRDSYRTLLQRSPDGHGTEVFITHQTMVEVYADNDKTRTVWQPGTPDPGMDLLFLQRLMVHLGLGEQQAKAMVAASTAPASAAAPARASLIESGTTLQINDGFDEAWRRVSLVVNTAGFTVTDRDRSAGRFDVRYVDPAASLKLAQQGSSFFSNWFGKKSNEPAPQLMHILLQSGNGVTRLTVQSDPGNPDADASRKAILDVLLQQLK